MAILVASSNNLAVLVHAIARASRIRSPQPSRHTREERGHGGVRDEVADAPRRPRRRLTGDP
jgi:hypothetical protein